MHPVLQGNKFYKLKYNIAYAQEKGIKTIVTFGGAYSNHIAATAAMGKYKGMQTVGVIRGEELGTDLKATLQNNATLKKATQNGMHLEFVTREDYRLKSTPKFLEKLNDLYPNALIIPEGGTNELAIKGCGAILTKATQNYDIICCAVGTGGTISGIIESSEPSQRVLGFPALKGEFLKNEISQWTARTNWDLIPQYHFGGYAKVNRELIDFINQFKTSHNIPLDPVYNGKMLFGILDLIKSHYFSSNCRILAVHTGGLQGIDAMNKKLVKKGLPVLQ